MATRRATRDLPERPLDPPMLEPWTPTRAFSDRREAGRALGAAFAALAEPDPIVLALPRGGVPVARELADAIGAPLDVLLVRKIGAPGQPELGIGAVAEGGVRLMDRTAVSRLGIPPMSLDAAVDRAEAELADATSRYRAGRPPLELAGRTAVVVDDGLATGGTAAAALQAVRRMGAKRVVLAVPVGAPEACERMRSEADEVVCLLVPSALSSVGQWYSDFGQVSDSEVLALLGRSNGAAAAATGGTIERPVGIDIGGGVVLNADLAVPDRAIGLVIFAHGSGSSRLSRRNRRVAEVLQQHGLATLLLDLLAQWEEGDRAKVFDVHLLAARLLAAREWAAAQPGVGDLPVGLFGASTGGGAALVAAAGRPGFAAVVSRGGRPDLAGSALVDVASPVMLIVGGADREVLALNRLAQGRLRCESRLEVVPGATHLFEEEGALEVVASLAADWFQAKMPPRPASAA
ncbi:MAG: phosphoribosyltransferase family protein [Actinomycetes bacterium]